MVPPQGLGEVGPGQCVTQQGLVARRVITSYSIHYTKLYDFSLLDALLNIPMSQALASLNLPESINNALVHDDGPYAPYLDLATACERFDQDAIGALADSIGLDADTSYNFV